MRSQCPGGNGKAPPPFTTDLNAIPQACAVGGTPAPPVASVVYFDKDFKFQQALKYSLGVDKRLPWGMVGTLDFLYSQAKNQMYQTDDNVKLGQVNGEGRQLYATPNAAGTALTRLKVTPALGQVVQHSNRSADKSTMFTAQLQKGFNGLSFSAAYTWSNSKDLMSLTSSVASSNLRFTALDGTLADRNLRPSGFDVRNKISISGSANLPFGIQSSVIFTARSGLPYAYVYNADANGDGNSGNDLFYVPKDINDITLAVPTGSTAQAEWDRLNGFINSESCLNDQRGQIMQRNSCRNPWQKFLDIRLAKVVPYRGQRVEITMDAFNFLNLINDNWGFNRETSSVEEVNLLTAGHRGIGKLRHPRNRHSVRRPGTLRRARRPHSARSSEGGNQQLPLADSAGREVCVLETLRGKMVGPKARGRHPRPPIVSAT